MSEFVEYNCDTNPYPSFGKKYNGEKAIISMTSWKMRIATCSKTLFSLLKQCPGFHIVLVLSEEEFPKMMDELPENLKLFVDNELIELMFVYKNYKSFKKVLFTMDKYRDVPVISADDDCIYTCNYAEKLYQEWLKHKDCVITPGIHIYKNLFTLSRGCATLFRPSCFLGKGIELLSKLPNYNNDDAYYSALYRKFNIKVFPTKYSAEKDFLFFHDTNNALHETVNKHWTNDMQIYFDAI